MNNRIQWIDIAKGIAIILMVIGHTSLPSIISRFIWAFHMPLFFIASGWTSNWDKDCFSVFAKRKTETLLLPFVLYSAIVLPISVHYDFMGYDSWLLNGWGGFALWFIPILYLSLLLAKIICAISNSVIRYFFMFVLLFCGCILCYYHCELPWSISAIPYATCLIVIGSKLRGWISGSIEVPQMTYMVLLFVPTLVISHFYRLDMCCNSILPIFPITIGAISGTLMTFILSSWLEKHVSFVADILQSIGRNTYVVVAFSQIIIMLLNHYFDLNAGLKYLILVVSLILLVKIKNNVNSLLGRNVL